jgi:hypothetical protein
MPQDSGAAPPIVRLCAQDMDRPFATTMSWNHRARCFGIGCCVAKLVKIRPPRRETCCLQALLLPNAPDWRRRVMLEV